MVRAGSVQRSVEGGACVRRDLLLPLISLSSFFLLLFLPSFLLSSYFLPTSFLLLPRIYYHYFYSFYSHYFTHYCTLLLYFTHYFTHSILPLTQATTAHRARHATNHAQKPPSSTPHTRSNPVSPPPARQPARSPSSSLPQPPPLSVTDSHRTIAFAHHRPGTRATSLPHHTRPRASTEHLPTRNGAANPPLPICDCPLRRRPRIRTKPVATLRLPEP